MTTTRNTTKPENEQQSRTAPSGNPLNRDALNLPNMITGSRLVLAIVLITLIYIQGFWITSAVVFFFAAWTDFLDGWIARKYGMVTVLGRILDPFVDKIIICGAFICLLPVQGAGLAAWMVTLIVARELLVTAIRSFLEKQGADFSASWAGKIKMILQCVAVGWILFGLGVFAAPESIPRWAVILRDTLVWATLFSTVYSGAIYIRRAMALMR